MLSRFLVARRWKKIQTDVAKKNYEIRPRVKAVRLAKLVKAEWARDYYSMQAGENIFLEVRHTNPVKLLSDLEKIIELIKNRQSLGTAYIAEKKFSLTLYEWLTDKDHKIVSAFLVTQELQRLIVEMSDEIDACYLSREDMYDYYQRMVVGYMEDVSEFLEAVLSLKLRK